MTLYFAYGSNMNIGQMAQRAPTAEPAGSLILPNWKLVFRGVADIVELEGASVPGALWRLTPEAEAALDRYEGFRDDGDGMYDKRYVVVDGLPDGETTVMIYTMNSTGIMPPSAGYFAGIKEGYADFDLSVAPLIAALEHSYEDKRPTYVERQRLRRTGRPVRAARPSVVATENKSPKERKQERKAAKRKLNKAERAAVKRANAKQFHDPWKGTYGCRPQRERMSLDKWMEMKYYGGEKF